MVNANQTRFAKFFLINGIREQEDATMQGPGVATVASLFYFTTSWDCRATMSFQGCFCIFKQMQKALAVGRRLATVMCNSRLTGEVP
jgi:hypothetical protein